MRHLRAHRKLGRTSAHRRQLLRNLVSSLFLSGSGRITTTVEKAKEARRMAEKMITLGKREGLHARRLAARYLTRRSVVKRLFDDIAPKFAERPGGYTRVLRLEPRPGDNADMAFLELVGIAEEAHRAAKEKAKEKAEKKKARDKDKEAAASAAGGDKGEEKKGKEPKAAKVPKAKKERPKGKAAKPDAQPKARQKGGKSQKMGP
jgi:large subunit ribosomal protein L17